MQVKRLEGIKLVEFYYNNHQRIVRPHTFAILSKENENLYPLQIDEPSDRDNVTVWRLVTFYKNNDLKILNEIFEDESPNHTKEDIYMI